MIGDWDTAALAFPPAVSSVQSRQRPDEDDAWVFEEIALLADNAGRREIALICRKLAPRQMRQ